MNVLIVRLLALTSLVSSEPLQSLLYLLLRDPQTQLSLLLGDNRDAFLTVVYFINFFLNKQLIQFFEINFRFPPTTNQKIRISF